MVLRFQSCDSARTPRPLVAGSERSLRRNLFWNYFSGSISLISLILFYPFGVLLSSIEQFGLWVLIFGGAQLLSATDFGLGDGVVRTLTGLIKDETPPVRLQEFVTVVLSLFVGMGMVVIAVYAVLLPRYLLAVELEELVPGLVTYALVAGGVSLMAAVGVRASNAILWSLDRQDIERKSAVVAVVLRAVAYLVVWQTGSGFLGVITADVLASLLPFVVCLVAVRRRFGGPRFVSPAFRTYAPPLVRLSVVLFMGSLASMLMLQLPLYVVGATMGLTAVTAFGALMRVYQSCRLVNSWMTNAFIHRISTGSGQALLQSVVAAHLLTLTMGLGMAIALAGLGDAFIQAWMGPAFAFAGSAMAIISVGALGDALTQPSRLVINLRGDPRWTALLANITLAGVLVGCYFAASAGDLFMVTLAVAGVPMLMAPLYLWVASRLSGGSPVPVRPHPLAALLLVVAGGCLVGLLRWIDAVLQPWTMVVAAGPVVGVVTASCLWLIWKRFGREVSGGRRDRLIG